MHCPTTNHVEMVKRVIRYLKYTINYRLQYTCNGGNVRVFCDADFSNDNQSSRSISGVAAFVYGNLVNWFSRRQRRIANSTCQSEILSIVEATLESEYIFNLLSEIQLDRVNQIVIFNDNNSARLTITGSGDFSKNKHYRTSINLVKEVIQFGWLRIQHCPTQEMLADYLTKALPESQLVKLVNLSNVCN